MYNTYTPSFNDRTHTQSHTDLGGVWLEVRLLPAAPLMRFVALIFHVALIGPEAAWRVGLNVGLILQCSTEGGYQKKKVRLMLTPGFYKSYYSSSHFGYTKTNLNLHFSELHNLQRI